MAGGGDPAMVVPFETARPALLGMAYRMLGTRADAEDVVQDVFLRWSEADRTDIRNPSAWLMTACTRRAIDVLRSVARARTDYVGPWLPEPLAEHWVEEPPARSAALETAFLMLLERASPKERAAFLLHEVFGHSHGEVAATLAVSEQASRKLASRARAHAGSGIRRQPIAPDRQRQLLAAFQDAIVTDVATAFSALLADDVRLVADGGGKAAAIGAPVEGRDQVMAFLETARNWWRSYHWTVERLATGYGILLRDGSAVIARIWVDGVDEQRVSTIYVMRNPDKLRAAIPE